MRGTSVHHYLHTFNYVCILLVISDMHTLVVRLHVYYMVHACVYVYSLVLLLHHVCTLCIVGTMKIDSCLLSAQRETTAKPIVAQSDRLEDRLT